MQEQKLKAADASVTALQISAVPGHDNVEFESFRRRYSMSYWPALPCS